MHRVLLVHRSGFYAWLSKPVSNRDRQDHRELGLIKVAYIASGKSYGSPRVHKDLMEMGEHCGVKHIARLMSRDGLLACRRYKRTRVLPVGSLRTRFLIVSNRYSPLMFWTKLG